MTAPELVDRSILRLRQVRGILEDADWPGKAIRKWLHTPHPRLDGRTPHALILDGAGRDVITEALHEVGR